VKNKTIIKPSKPIIVKGFLGCMIKLNKNQIDYGNLKSRKELKGFREQTNRHITVIGGGTSEKIEKVLNKLSILKRNKKVAELKSILKNLEWQYIQKEIYFINQKSHFGNPKILEHRESYIRIIKMPDLKIFYHKLNTLLKTHIPMKFPHITLFTKGERPNPEYFGIAIPSKNVFKKLHPKIVKN
jgi:hypothetical protein